MSKGVEAAIDRLTYAIEDRSLILREHHAEEQRRERERREAARIGHRSEPRRLDFGLMMRAVPGLAQQFSRQIPGEFWTLVGSELVEVACPCGVTPAARLGIPVTCECSRVYLYTGEQVRVAAWSVGGHQAAAVDNEGAPAGEVSSTAG